MKKQDIDILMSYLYEELDASQKQELEVRLTQDAALRAELEQLQQTRGWLQVTSDEPIHTPPLIISQAVSQPSLTRQWLGSRWLQMAAAVALLLFAGRMSGLQVHTEDKQLVIGFTSPPAQVDEEAESHWQAEIMAGQTDLENTLCALDEGMARMQTHMEKPTTTRLDRRQVAALQASLLAETQKSFDAFFATAEQKHADQLGDWLAQYNFHVQEQRDQDLESIEYALNELIQRAAFQQVETDNLRTEIIDRLEEGR